MKITRLIFISLIPIFAALLYFAMVQNAGQPTQNQWEKKTDAQGPISVTLTPIAPEQKDAPWKFGLVLTSHSVEITENPIEAFSLLDDQNNSYQPTRWEGPGPGGHHREGMLFFNPIRPTPASLEIKIKNIGGIAERSLKWNRNL